MNLVKAEQSKGLPRILAELVFLSIVIAIDLLLTSAHTKSPR